MQPRTISSSSPPPLPNAMVFNAELKRCREIFFKRSVICFILAVASAGTGLTILSLLRGSIDSKMETPAGGVALALFFLAVFSIMGIKLCWILHRMRVGKLYQRCFVPPFTAFPQAPYDRVSGTPQ